MLCWLLLCSDCGIRSGTAAKLTPSQYDASLRLLRYRTKHANTQTAHVTERVHAMLMRCSDTSLPFVCQLPRGQHWRGARAELKPLGHVNVDTLHENFRALKRRLGLRKELKPHDLRRTTARRVYEQTHDLRAVQELLGHRDLATTMWYLQDETSRITAAALEAAAVATEVVQ